VPRRRWWRFEPAAGDRNSARTRYLDRHHIRPFNSPRLSRFPAGFPGRPTLGPGNGVAKDANTTRRSPRRFPQKRPPSGGLFLFAASKKKGHGPLPERPGGCFAQRGLSPFFGTSWNRMLKSSAFDLGRQFPIVHALFRLPPRRPTYVMRT
jgi:hypothetical protein